MALEDNIRLFSQIPLFRMLELDALKLAVFSTEQVVLRAGDVLFREPFPMAGGHVLTRGSLALFPTGDQIGQPTKIIKAPTLIGEMALFCETDSAGSAVAREPSTALFLSRQLFQRVLHEYPTSAQRLRDMILERLQVLSKDLSKLSVG